MLRIKLTYSTGLVQVTQMTEGQFRRWFCARGGVFYTVREFLVQCDEAKKLGGQGEARGTILKAGKRLQERRVKETGRQVMARFKEHCDCIIDVLSGRRSWLTPCIQPRRHSVHLTPWDEFTA